MEVHCTNEEAGGKKQVLAEFRLEEVFLPFRNDRRPKKGDSVFKKKKSQELL